MSDHATSAENDTPLRCRLFGHRWEQTTVDGVWRFRCQRCARVEGYCGQTRPIPPGSGDTEGSPS